MHFIEGPIIAQNSQKYFSLRPADLYILLNIKMEKNKKNYL